MAMLKTIDPGNGVVTTYHRISEMVIDFDGMSAAIRVSSYVNQTIRQSSIGNVASEPVRYSVGGAPDGVDPRAWGYTQLELLPDFAGATEV